MHIRPIAQAPTGADAVPDSAGLNLWRADPTLRALAAHHLPPDLLAHLEPHLDRLGALAGGPLDALAAEADRNPPHLEPRTRRGEDRQRIHKHPAYREMERLAFGEYGLAALSHRPGVLGWPAPMPPAAKYLLTMLFVQAEFGLCCPVSMTDSLSRTLRKFGDPALVARYLPALTSQDMDALSQGAMFMTEQGAGSDIANTAVTAEENPDSTWSLQGDKWFCSNPDAGLAMVLARRAGAGPGLNAVSLFLLPRELPDGTPNAHRIIRLKDKLGTRSMASGEISLNGATAFLVGDAGAGFKQMADMVNNSRLSNGVRAAGLMRRATTEALFIAHRRVAFGKRIAAMPLMRRQLLKLLLPTEQARAMVFLAAEALRRSDAGEEGAYPLLRILTPLLKFRACRDARKVTGDAMEVRGGCGYIEEFPDARLLRDAHLGSIWEGTSNIVALDVGRAIARENALPALEARVRALCGNGFPEALALWPQVAALARRAQEDPSLARQSASALYHLASAAALHAEAAALPERATLARLVLRHRLLPRDPLAPEEPFDDSALLPDPGAAA